MEVGQSPNWGCSTKGKKNACILYLHVFIWYFGAPVQFLYWPTVNLVLLHSVHVVYPRNKILHMQLYCDLLVPYFSAVGIATGYGLDNQRVRV
jgi:hypothetical protein